MFVFSQDMGNKWFGVTRDGVLAAIQKQGSRDVLFASRWQEGMEAQDGLGDLAIYTLGTVKILLSCKFRLYVIFRRQSPKGFLWSFIHEARGRSF